MSFPTPSGNFDLINVTMTGSEDDSPISLLNSPMFLISNMTTKIDDCEFYNLKKPSTSDIADS